MLAITPEAGFYGASTDISDIALSCRGGGDWTTRKKRSAPGVEVPLNWELIFQFDQIRGVR